MSKVFVKGQGIAGLAAANRLAHSGLNVEISGHKSSFDRIVTIDPSVEQLFLMEYGNDFFQSIPILRIRSKKVLWEKKKPQTVSGPLLSLALSDLISQMFNCMPHTVKTVEKGNSKDSFFQVIATGRQRENWFRSGDRITLSWEIDKYISEDMCAILASKEGWMFLCSAPNNKMFIQFTVPGRLMNEAEKYLVASNASLLLLKYEFNDLAKLIKDKHFSIFDSTPIFSDPYPRKNCINIGDAAFSGDPLSGDGIGRAIRSAVHAAALITKPNQSNKFSRQYIARLALAHMHSLESLCSFYENSICSLKFADAIIEMRRDIKKLKKLSMSYNKSNRLIVTQNAQRFVF